MRRRLKKYPLTVLRNAKKLSSYSRKRTFPPTKVKTLNEWLDMKNVAPLTYVTVKYNGYCHLEPPVWIYEWEHDGQWYQLPSTSGIKK